MFIDMEPILIKFVVLRVSDNRKSLKTFLKMFIALRDLNATWSTVVFTGAYGTIVRSYTESEAASEHVWKWSSAICSFGGSCTFLVDVRHAKRLQISTDKEI